MAELLSRKVRVEERLRIKIGEAKNLPSRNHGCSDQRDVFCVISLDQEEIFRTAALDKSLSPYFGDEFQFSVPRKFRYLSVYLYDRDKSEKVIGKVAIKREDLHLYHDAEHWFQIKPVTEHTEVQGKVHLDVKFENGVDAFSDKLVVKVLECSDLTLSNGSCDPFAVVSVRLTSGKEDQRRTKVRRKTNSPVFDESFTFELNNWGSSRGCDTRYNIAEQEGNWCELVVTLYHDNGSNSVFLGEVRVPLQRNLQQSAWYLLQPGKRGSAVSTDLGKLRLKIHYTRDYVFDAHMYDSLLNIILDSASVPTITSSACFLLGEIISTKYEFSQSLTRIFVQHGLIVPIIKALASREMSRTKDPTTLFRSNSLVVKMIDETMRLAGSHYLQETLKPALDLVISEKKCCEIDPYRVSDPSAIYAHLNNLKEYVENIFFAITGSALRCPPILCELFHELREIAASHFPDHREVKYAAISGFIFLRFFTPAILGPRLFDLTNKHIDPQVDRTLTLIAKTIQTLCNLAGAKAGLCKQPYMAPVYKAFITSTHVTAIRQFLEIISASSNPSSDNNDSPVVLKEGSMMKRAQGRRRFGRKNFQQRYFTLTTHGLTYSKQKGKEPLCKIPLSDVLAVERVQHESFRKSNMFQIVLPHRVLYVQASNCVEEKDWVDLLDKMCCTNRQRLQKYHPAAYVNGHWQCCHVASESAEGCSKVSTKTQLQMNIDSERELARIHSLIIEHMDNLQGVINICETRPTPRRSDSPLSCIIEDSTSCLKTLVALREAAIILQTETRIYLRTLARETKYGSKQAPIGDDNYFILANRLDGLLLGSKTCSDFKYQAQ